MMSGDHHTVIISIMVSVMVITVISSNMMSEVVIKMISLQAAWCQKWSLQSDIQLDHENGVRGGHHTVLSTSMVSEVAITQCYQPAWCQKWSSHSAIKQHQWCQKWSLQSDMKQHGVRSGHHIVVSNSMESEVVITHC